MTLPALPEVMRLELQGGRWWLRCEGRPCADWANEPSALSVALAMRRDTSVSPTGVENWADKAGVEIGDVYRWRRIRQPGKPLHRMTGEEMGRELRTILALAPSLLDAKTYSECEDLMVQLDLIMREKQP